MKIYYKKINCSNILAEISSFFDNRIRVFLYDILITALAILIAFQIVLRNEESLLTQHFTNQQILIFSLISAGFYCIFKTYSGFWRYFSWQQAIVLLMSTSLSCLVFAPILLYAHMQSIDIPVSLLFICWLTVSAAMVGSRLGMKLLYDYWFFDKIKINNKVVVKTILLGVNDNTKNIINALNDINTDPNVRSFYDIIGIFAENQQLVGSNIQDINVLGHFEQIIEKLDKLYDDGINFNTIIVTNDALPGNSLKKIMQSLHNYKLNFLFLDKKQLRPISLPRLLPYCENNNYNFGFLKDLHICVYGVTQFIAQPLINKLLDSGCRKITLWNSDNEIDIVNVVQKFDNKKVKVLAYPASSAIPVAQKLAEENIDVMINLSSLYALNLRAISSHSLINSFLLQNNLIAKLAMQAKIKKYYFVGCNIPHYLELQKLCKITSKMLRQMSFIQARFIQLPFVLRSNDTYFGSLLKQKGNILVPKIKIAVISVQKTVKIILQKIEADKAGDPDEENLNVLSYSQIIELYSTLNSFAWDGNITEEEGKLAYTQDEQNLYENCMDAMQELNYSQCLALLSN